MSARTGFRAGVFERVGSGRPVTEIAVDLGVSAQTIYSWRRQHLIDTGQCPGVRTCDAEKPVTWSVDT